MGNTSEGWQQDRRVTTIPDVPLSGGDKLTVPRQLMEVSQLLRLYQARGWEALPAEDLLLHLKRLEHSG